jgi:hypothetical protein
MDYFRLEAIFRPIQDAGYLLEMTVMKIVFSLGEKVSPEVMEEMRFLSCEEMCCSATSFLAERGIG